MSISLTEARAQLSTLVGQANPRGPLTAITVRDELKAYLVTPEQLDALVAAERQERYSAHAHRPRLRGTLRIVDDLEAASGEAHDLLLKAALDSSKEEPEQ